MGTPQGRASRQVSRMSSLAGDANAARGPVQKMHQARASNEEEKGSGVASTRSKRITKDKAPAKRQQDDGEDSNVS